MSEPSRQPQPRRVDLVSDAVLRIRWRDGASLLYDARPLRLACPCAACVEEGTGRKLLVDASVPEHITITGSELVGRYALSFRFSDGHATGIYPWRLLRDLPAARPGDGAESG